MQFDDPKSILEAAAATPSRGIDPHTLLKRGARARRVRFASAATGLAIVVAGASVSSGWVGGGDGHGPAGDGASRCEEGPTSVVIYLDYSAAKREVAALRTELESNPDVRRVEYVSREQALEEFAEAVSDEVDPFEAPPPNGLPASFRVEAVGKTAAERLLVVTGPAVEEVRLWPREEDLACLARTLCARPIPLEASVFLRDVASRAEIAALQASLLATPGVRKVDFFSKKEAYEEFRRLYEDQPHLYEALPRDALPASLRVTVADEGALERLHAVTSPAVEEVRSGLGLRDHCPEDAAPVEEPAVVESETAEPVDRGSGEPVPEGVVLRSECSVAPLDLAGERVAPLGKWCRFVLRVDNDGEIPLVLERELQLLHTEDGTLRPWPLAMQNQYLSVQLFETPIPPGESRVGQVVYALSSRQVPGALTLQLSHGAEPIQFLLRYDCAADLHEEARGKCFFEAERVDLTAGEDSGGSAD